MHLTDLVNNTYSIALLAALLLALILLALYYGLIYLRVGLWKGRDLPAKEPADEETLPTVSVVLVAHNEGPYLRDNLVYLLEQDYPRFEVIVVDYRSTDDTSFVLQVCGANYKHLKTIRLDNDVTCYTGKKYPLSIGIRSAKGDVVLLTEPDSVPKDFNWIRSMMAGYRKNADIVLGHSILRQEKGLFNTLMQYDHLSHQSHALGMALMGCPYTGNGRNLSYKRDFFFDRGAFTRHYTEPEGADDLFVNQNAHRRNCTVVLSPEAAVVTRPQPTWGSWRLQRKGHYAPKRWYPLKDLLLLAYHPLSLLLFYLAGTLMACQNMISLIVFGIATVMLWAWQIFSFSRVCKRFDTKHVHWLAPLLEIYFFFANNILCIFALLRHKK